MSSDVVADMTGREVLISRIKRRVRRLVRRNPWIPVGSVRWGDFRRGQPICSNFGYSRGKPIDRYYIEAFIGTHADDVSGRVLEIKDAGYTRRFGGSRVERSDVLDFNADNKAATIVGDLNDAAVLEDGAYDCIILTQTLQYLFDPAKVIRNLHRSLKPGGVLLVTVPGITPIRDAGAVWYWNFTTASLERLLSEGFTPSVPSVRSYGNLASVTGSLYGLSTREMGKAELDRCDPAYQLLIVARVARARQ